MRRRSTTRVHSLFEAAAWLAGTLTACLSSEAIDLGTNYSARSPEPDSSAVLPESGAEGGVDAASGDAADVGPDAPTDDGDTDAPAPPGAAVCVLNPSFELAPTDPPPASPL